jgi:hypothetical protein
MQRLEGVTHRERPGQRLPQDVRDMLEFYGVEEERREELVEHTRLARRKGWWEAYSDTLAVPLVGLEVAADRILAYEAMVVHGLLQTEDYTRALIRAVRPDVSPAQIERWVAFRMTRQDLLRQHAPPTSTSSLRSAPFAGLWVVPARCGGSSSICWRSGTCPT